nr:hypothetical protein [Methylomarinum sp. Ch1-1]MDP4520049.1 hypothetical protein [Methylomarinum sp. Ch1-1]
MRIKQKVGRFCLILFCASLTTTCSIPAREFSLAAAEYGISQQTVQGLTFRHRVFINAAAQQPSHQDNLHIYIDGDGTPWMRGRWPTSDPTARNPMILKILQADPSPAILLGRPCYHGLGESNACDVRYWTSHRYAQAVVDSMKTALRRWAAKTSHPKLTLIGFSGGGVLSVLMSYDLKEVETLITVAANLDVAAWSRQHNYRPLPQSLNPVDSPPPRAHQTNPFCRLARPKCAGGNHQTLLRTPA